MERLCDLYFELSNKDRLSILEVLTERPTRLTGLSGELGITSQQCMRHMSRLVETGLAAKDPEGFYALPPYGELTLRQYGGQLFAAEHKDYFNRHTLAGAPNRFVSRLGELSNSTYVDDEMVVFRNIERVNNAAEEHVWRITDRYLMIVVSHAAAACERGIEMRLVEPSDIVYPPDIRDTDVFERAWREGLFKNRILERVDTFLAMSEREVAAVAFRPPTGGPTTSGSTPRTRGPSGGAGTSSNSIGIGPRKKGISGGSAQANRCEVLHSRGLMMFVSWPQRSEARPNNSLFVKPEP